MEEIRVIKKRQTKGNLELFVLDSWDLVAEDVGAIPKDTYIVSYVSAATCKPYPGVCTRGRIHPAPNGAMATPLLKPRGPLCACRLFQGKPEVLLPATDSWISEQQRNTIDIVCIPKGAPIHTYAWCHSRLEGTCYDSDFNLIIGEQLSDWERALLNQLRGLSGYYSVVVAGTKCVGVWNFIIGIWVGSPVDSRIASHIGMEFAPAFVAQKEEWHTVEDLREQCPADCTLILRRPYEIGHYVTKQSYDVI